MMHRYDSADGLTLAYRDEGTGRPVIALAGLTRNSRDFDYLAAHLADVRLIRPDYRGRGDSGWSPDPATYTAVQEAQDVLRLMDHLGLDRAAFLGTSRGGLISMLLAATAKDRLTGVCLNDIGPVIAPEGLAVILDYIGRDPGFATQEEMARAMAASSPGFEGVPAARWLEEVQRRTVQTADGVKLNYDPRLRERFTADMSGPAPDLWPLFDALEGLPLALVRGANSDLLTDATAAEMRRRRPDMIYAEVPGRGHVPFLDETEALAAIRTWLEKLP